MTAGRPVTMPPTEIQETATAMEYQFECQRCATESGRAGRNALRIEIVGEYVVRGTFQCSHHGQLAERPFLFLDGYLEALNTALPGTASDRLNAKVPADLRADIQEAERANYAQCYKAAAGMCRRAVQLALIEHRVTDGPLGKMLLEALSSKVIDQVTFNLATSIKGFGDIGMHRKESIDPSDIPLVLSATVRMLNEAFPG